MEGIGSEVFKTLIIVLFIWLIIFIYFFKRRDSRNLQNNLINGERRRFNEEDDGCSICFSSPHNLPLETNCGHVFCGICLKTLRETRIIDSQMACPMCRTKVTILFICFSEAEQEADADSDVGKERATVVSFANSYNRSMEGGIRGWIEVIWNAPILMRYLFNSIRNNDELIRSLQTPGAIGLINALIYFLLPIDIIPEYAFGILGYIDDLLVCVMITMHLLLMYRNLLGAPEVPANQISPEQISPDAQ